MDAREAGLGFGKESAGLEKKKRGAGGSWKIHLQESPRKCGLEAGLMECVVMESLGEEETEGHSEPLKGTDFSRSAVVPEDWEWKSPAKPFNERLHFINEWVEGHRAAEGKADEK